MNKGFRFRFDSEKAIEVIVYLAEHAPIPDIYHVLKIIYFADKAHLERYGRFICGDSYVAMKHGPVPSATYDIIKYVRGDGYMAFNEHASRSFEVQPDERIVSCRSSNLDLMSESDLSCLNVAIESVGRLSFDELKKRSHDSAYESADINDFITVEKIAETFPEGALLIDYLHNS